MDPKPISDSDYILDCCCAEDNCPAMLRNQAKIMNLTKNLTEAGKCGLLLLDREKVREQSIAAKLAGLELDIATSKRENSNLEVHINALETQLQGTTSRYETLLDKLRSTSEEAKRQVVRARRVQDLEISVERLELDYAHIEGQLHHSRDLNKEAERRERQVAMQNEVLEDLLDRVTLESIKETENYNDALESTRRRVRELEEQQSNTTLPPLHVPADIQSESPSPEYLEEVITDNFNLRQQIISLRQELEESRNNVWSLQEQITLSSIEDSLDSLHPSLQTELIPERPAPARAIETHVHHHYHVSKPPRSLTVGRLKQPQYHRLGRSKRLHSSGFGSSSVSGTSEADTSNSFDSPMQGDDISVYTAQTTVSGRADTTSRELDWDDVDCTTMSPEHTLGNPIRDLPRPVKQPIPILSPLSTTPPVAHLPPSGSFQGTPPRETPTPIFVLKVTKARSKEVAGSFSLRALNGASSSQSTLATAPISGTIDTVGVPTIMSAIPRPLFSSPVAATSKPAAALQAQPSTVEIEACRDHGEPTRTVSDALSTLLREHNHHALANTGTGVTFKRLRRMFQTVRSIPDTDSVNPTPLEAASLAVAHGPSQANQPPASIFMPNAVPNTDPTTANEVESTTVVPQPIGPSQPLVRKVSGALGSLVRSLSLRSSIPDPDSTQQTRSTSGTVRAKSRCPGVNQEGWIADLMPKSRAPVEHSSSMNGTASAPKYGDRLGSNSCVLGSTDRLKSVDDAIVQARQITEDIERTRNDPVVTTGLMTPPWLARATPRLAVAQSRVDLAALSDALEEDS